MVHAGFVDEISEQRGRSWPVGGGGMTGVIETGAESDRGMRVSGAAWQFTLETPVPEPSPVQLMFNISVPVPTNSILVVRMC
jgi:hypothetical protein